MRRQQNEITMALLAGIAVGYVGYFLLNSFKNFKNGPKQAASINKLTWFDPKPIPIKPTQVNSDNFLIVVNGDFLPRSVILEIAHNRKIIALDGAADKLIALGIVPHVILGDFDSIADPERWGISKTFDHIDNESKSYLGKYDILIVPAKDQDLTDLSKGIRYCDGLNAKRIDIVCARGGRADHDLGNIRVLRVEYKQERIIYFHTDTETMQYVKDETCTIRGEVKDSCGILAFPKGSFKADDGLAYTEYPLDFGFQESSCNQLTKPTAIVEVKGEAIIVMPGLFPAQKQFKQLTYSEKLGQLWTESARKVTSKKTQDKEKPTEKQAELLSIVDESMYPKF